MIYIKNASDVTKITSEYYDDNSIRNELSNIESKLSSIQSQLNGKSNTDHLHDERYYTEGQVDSLLSNKANSSHNHYEILSRGGSNRISFDWVNKGSAGWKIQFYVDGKLQRDNW